MNEITALTVFAVFAMAFLAAVQPTFAEGRNPWAPAGQSYVPQDPQTTGNVFSGSGRPSGGYSYQAPPAASPAPPPPVRAGTR